MPEEESIGLVGALIVLAFYLAPLWLLILAFFTGRHFEKKHYASIRAREAATANLPAVPIRTGEEGRGVAEVRLVSAGVVVSLDYFRRFLASLRQIFGGRVRSYEGLLDRARREALLRIKEQMPDADIILNLRFETANIANAAKKNAVAAVEVLAYGTAVRYAR